MADHWRTPHAHEPISRDAMFFIAGMMVGGLIVIGMMVVA